MLGAVGCRRGCRVTAHSCVSHSFVVVVVVEHAEDALEVRLGFGIFIFAISAKVTTRAVKPVTRAQAVAAPADVSSETVMDCVNTIRFLAIDAINKSNSGHPGLPMGCAPMGYVIFREAMTHNPKNYQWFNRDRFVLSAGHGLSLIHI